MVLPGEPGTSRSPKEGCIGPGRTRSRSKPPCRSVWRAPVIQATGSLRLEDRLSSRALSCSGLCRAGVRTKFGIDMVLPGEPGTSRSPKEGCIGPGRTRSRSKPPCRSVSHTNQSKFYECVIFSSGVVARACNPSYRESETGGSFELKSSELQRTMSSGCPH
ncbi:unnamed protein product [Pleuronectes platessa]|uniref:Uncharacterized protein n=1 Tax=Pleuronectes platessa TaxID=8262 RepID=A0A9N7Y663_PLEPL|nr:unnamed protein product [Pleuronectes platessa]